jgi:hypothetical protein
VSTPYLAFFLKFTHLFSRNSPLLFRAIKFSGFILSVRYVYTVAYYVALNVCLHGDAGDLCKK